MLPRTHFDPRPQVKNKLPPNPEVTNAEKAVKLGRFPSWLHRKLPRGKVLKETGKALNGLNTVCEEAKCPNLLECWSKKTATFLIMGSACTRACGFCDIDFAKAPPPLDPEEPTQIAESVLNLGLNHVVITQVARDDLSDGGAAHLVAVINAIREKKQDVTIEVLTSDFAGNAGAWQTVIDAKPEIFNHNIETVQLLTPRVRHKATYKRTLELLSYVNKNSNLIVKSGIMVGLGETPDQVEKTIEDLANVGCQIITIGQYLQASPKKLRVKAFITPEQFKHYEHFGLSLGVKYMYCGPFVRSSYNAKHVLEEIQS